MTKNSGKDAIVGNFSDDFFRQIDQLRVIMFYYILKYQTITIFHETLCILKNAAIIMNT